ncbi:MAG: glycosyltransferase family 2 protein [Ruminococcus sp.]|nr:glycosyltransferase family 2 protein [Ruminococcus sp.]
MAEIAILTATYNGGKYIRELLDSIAAQTYSDYNIYIHDDGSDDGTPGIIREYRHSHPDMKITVLKYPPTGSACRNFMSMLKYAKEPYIMFCDQDDIWKNDKIETVYNEMRRIEGDKSEKPCLVFSDLYVVNSELEIISDSFMRYSGRNPHRTDYRSLLMKNSAPGCTMIINRSLAERMLLCRDFSKIGMHDIWAMTIASLTGEISYIDKPLIYYRQHTGNVVGAKKSSPAAKYINTLKLILSGQQAGEKKIWLDNVSRLAGLLAATQRLSEKDRIFLKRLAAIRKKDKAVRIRFYYKNGLIDGKKWWLALWV